MVGELIRTWRRERRMSQLDLAEAAEVSTRHISFVETGRSSPSREMVLVLSSALDIPLRERNTLLQAAGFAPVYRETDLDAPEMASVARAVGFMLDRMEPYGAVVVDRAWNLLRLNTPMERMMTLLTEQPVPEGVNMLRASFDPDGLRPYIANFDVIGPVMLHRVRRELAVEPDEALQAVVDDVLAMPGIGEIDSGDISKPPALLIPLEIEKGPIRLSLFTTITTIGTPVDITLSELRIESYFPADDATEALVRQLMATP